MADEMNGAQQQQEVQGPMVDFLAQMLADLKAGRIVTYSFVWVNSEGRVHYQNFGAVSIPMYITLHECADTWRKSVFQPTPQSGILRPAGPLPPDAALRGNRP